MTATAIAPAREVVYTTSNHVIVLENPAPHARTDWVSFTMPEAKLPTCFPQLGPFPAFVGRRVGEGIVNVHARVSVGALAQQSFALQGIDHGQRIETGMLDAVAAVPGVHIVINGADWQPKQDLIADGPCTILHMHGRVPGTQCVGEFWAYIYPGAPVVRWELLVVASDPTVTDVYQQINSIVLSVDGPVVVSPYWPAWRGARQFDANTVELTRATTMGDTQGLAWAGVLALATDASAGAAFSGPICAMATRGTWEGHWGPFGRTVEDGPATNGYVQALLAWHWATLTTGDVWRAPRLGLLPNSGQTGGQNDFGATKLGWAFLGGPLHILDAYHSALHEACRPGHWREQDGTPAEPWNHPNHVTWDGYTHWHPSVSGDRMGKGSAQAPRFSGGYIGPDREHWSNNLLCGTYLLTGSLLLQRIIEKQARQILSGETIDPRLSTSNAGAPRGVGRTMHAAAWVWRCLDQGDLLTRVRERIRARLAIIERQTRPVVGLTAQSEERRCYNIDGEEVPRLVVWAGTAETPISEAYSGAVGLIDDPRAMGSGVVCVATWQEALAIVGLRAAALDGDPNAALVLRRAAEAWMQHGWWEQDGRWWLADYVSYLDPSVRVRREGFEEWSTGALRICANVLDGELQQKAATILASMPCSTVTEAEWRATA